MAGFALLPFALMLATARMPVHAALTAPRSIGVAYPAVDIHPGTEFEAFDFSGAPGYLSHFWITAGLEYDNETLVRYYVDGETVPSIVLRPLEAVGVFFPNGTHSGGEPWQNSLFGKTGEDVSTNQGAPSPLPRVTCPA